MRAFTVVVIATVFFSILPITHAQTDDQSLRLITSPIPVSLVTEPGKSISTDLRVQNAGPQTETLKAGLLKFSAYGDTGVPKLEDRAPGDDYFDWVTFSEPTFTLAPNEWKTIKMTIAVPTEAAFGYYYAVTFSRSQEQVSQSQPQAALVGSTATLVLLEAKVPGAKREAHVDEFVTDQPWYEFVPVGFKVGLQNTGNVHVAPRGNIFISRGGKEVGLVEVNPAKGNILPDSRRVFIVSWDDGFPKLVEQSSQGKVILDKEGQQQYQIQWKFSEADKLRIGKYQAKLVMVYDDGTKDVPIEATTEFWIIPWRLIIGLILIPLVPALLVYLFMKWRMKKMRDAS